MATYTYKSSSNIGVQLRRGASFHHKYLWKISTKKKNQPDESDPNSFDVETGKNLAEWYRENEIFYNKKIEGPQKLPQETMTSV